MIKLKIIDKDKYVNYILEDISNKKYKLNINFMDIEEPSIGDYIYIDKEVIKENVSLNYGPANKDNNINENEVMVLVKEDNKIYLQRYYG